MSADGQGLRISQVAAGALAAATAAVLGSTLGVAGTVFGAAIASVISTVGGALYLRSLERTGKGVRTIVRAKRTDPLDDVAPDTVAPDLGPSRRIHAGIAILGAVVAFAVGMGVVTGLEWVRGEPLSGGGQGTTIGGLVVPKPPARHSPPESRTPSTSEQPPSVEPTPSPTTTPPTMSTTVPSVPPTGPSESEITTPSGSVTQSTVPSVTPTAQ